MAYVQLGQLMPPGLVRVGRPVLPGFPKRKPGGPLPVPGFWRPPITVTPIPKIMWDRMERLRPGKPIPPGVVEHLQRLPATMFHPGMYQRVKRLRPGQPLPMELSGLGDPGFFKKVFKKVAKVVKKVAAVAVAPIVAVATAPFAPKLAPKLLKSAGVIGAKKAEKLTKIIKSAVVPAAIIAGGAFLLPVLGATTLPSLSGVGGFLSKASGGIMGTLKSVLGILTPPQRQSAEEAIAAGQPPPASLPAEFLDAYMRAVTTQAAQRPELLPSPPGGPAPWEEASAQAPVAEAGIMGLGGTGTLIALGAAGLVVTMAMGGGNGRGRRRG